MLPRSVSHTSLAPASRAFSTGYHMSRPERNCAFLMFTMRPVLAAATSKSVCRQRKAGIWITSHTSPTGSACVLSWISVRILKPYFDFTSLNIWSPRSSPGPLKEWMEVRFALSNEALKIMSVPSLVLISNNLRATVSSNSADSMTQGPAMMVVLLLI